MSNPFGGGRTSSFSNNNSNNNNNRGGGGRYNSRGGGGRNSSSQYRGGRSGNRSRGSSSNRSNHSGGRPNSSNSNNANYGESQGARFKPCKSWTNTGKCNNPNCEFAHIVKTHATVPASNQDTSATNDNNDNNNYNHHHRKVMHPVTDVAIWETQGIIKIFTASHDGFWRLWNTSGGSFVQEFESNMRGKVECLAVVNNFLFCGLEAPPLVNPHCPAGMCHVWNLNQPSAPPSELQLQTTHFPYAHNYAVTALEVDVSGVVPKVFTGSSDGSIRAWSFRDNAFGLETTLPGHQRDVSGLIYMPANNLLWSSGMDGLIRIWDLSKPPLESAMHKIDGHTNAVTSLLQFNSPAGVFVLSSSLDGYLKAWNGANGECVASENNKDGVTCMCLAQDPKDHPVVLLGMQSGSLVCRNLVQTPQTPAFQKLFVLIHQYTAGHTKAVRAIAPGPSSTFYSVGEDGNMMVWQLMADLQI